MRLALLARLLGRRPRPPIEVLDLRLSANTIQTCQAPPGGWRCGRCGAHAVYLVTWPGQHAGWYCADHAPRHAAAS